LVRHPGDSFADKKPKDMNSKKFSEVLKI